MNLEIINESPFGRAPHGELNSQHVPRNGSPEKKNRDSQDIEANSNWLLWWELSHGARESESTSQGRASAGETSTPP